MAAFDDGADSDEMYARKGGKQNKKDNKACHIIRLYRRAKAAKEATQELEITQVNLSTNLSNNNRLKTRKLKKKSKN